MAKRGNDGHESQVGALVRELVLEKFLAGEVLEVRIVDPAFAYAFVG
jgi:hypothetical protein